MKSLRRLGYPLSLFAVGCIFAAILFHQPTIWNGGTGPGKGAGGATTMNSPTTAILGMLLFGGLSIAAFVMSWNEFKQAIHTSWNRVGR